ncbi:hypothetical protein Efla_001341 [Eimeria flavescens]
MRGDLQISPKEALMEDTSRTSVLAHLSVHLPQGEKVTALRRIHQERVRSHICEAARRGQALRTYGGEEEYEAFLLTFPRLKSKQDYHILEAKQEYNQIELFKNFQEIPHSRAEDDVSGRNRGGRYEETLQQKIEDRGIPGFVINETWWRCTEPEICITSRFDKEEIFLQALEETSRLWVLPIQIQGNEVEALVDMGDTRSFILPSLA